MATETDAEKIKTVLGGNLVTLAEYQTGDDTTLLAICNSIDFDTLHKLKGTKEIPLLLTKEELLDGADVFPIEFLNIKQHHTMLDGEDLLKDLVISKKHLRHQLEFEFRSKLLHIRGEYLRFKGKDLERLALAAAPVLAPIVGSLLYLKDLPASSPGDMWRAVSDAYDVDTDVLREIYDIRRGNAKFKKEKERYIRDIIKVLSDIGEIVDEFEVIE
jgi:hypothetical protein